MLAVTNNGIAGSDWSSVKEPIQLNHKTESIGTYNAGCLSGGISLPINGQGYQLMRLSRNRSYGHPQLIRFIETISKTISLHHWGTLLIGDLGQPRGGPTPTGHRSHQTGLDVDIWYLLSADANLRPLTIDERENWNAHSVLREHSDDLDYQNWSIDNEKVLEVAANQPEVERIFVNPSIKRLLCSHYPNQTWIQKIRPWWKHDDHFHVRLKCPTDNPHCIKQDDLPKGNGCDDSLAWWFSDEAKKPVPMAKKTEPSPLPILCNALLKQ